MKILYFIYANPGAYPPLEHGARVLADSGATVLVLGIGAPFGADRLEIALPPGVTIRRFRYCPPGWKQKFHYLAFGAWAFWQAIRFRPDKICGCDWFACPVLLLLGYFWCSAYHENDVPLSAFNYTAEASTSKSKDTPFIRFVLWARRRAARRAQVCIAPNDGRATSLRSTTLTKQPIYSVWNCPSLHDLSDGPRRARTSDSLVLFFHGSIVPERLPVTILSAIKHTPSKMVLRIAGYETVGCSGYSGYLREQADKLRISDRVTFLGAIPLRDDLLRECRLADVGLALMPLQSTDYNHQTMAGASNKPFDYLACGLALLVSQLKDWEEMYVANGYAKSCDPSDLESIADALLWFSHNRDEAKAMGERGKTRIREEWNYEKQFAPVARLLLDEN